MEWLIIAAILFHAFKPQIEVRCHYAKKQIIRKYREFQKRQRS